METSEKMVNVDHISEEGNDYFLVVGAEDTYRETIIDKSTYIFTGSMKKADSPSIHSYRTESVIWMISSEREEK